MAKENNLPIQTVTPYNTVSHTSPSFVYRVLQPIQLDYNSGKIKIPNENVLNSFLIAAFYETFPSNILNARMSNQRY